MMTVRYIYKFMKREHAESLKNLGIVRVGTLFDFKDIINYSDGIGDAGEGILTSRMDGHTIIGDDPTTHPPQVARVFKSGSIVINKASLKILGEFREVSQNHYVYSMSLAKNPGIAESLGYDTCVLIRNPIEFISKLTYCLRRNSYNVLDPQLGEVTYHERNTRHDRQTGVYPAFVKDPSFSIQQEIRAIWQCIATDLEPVIIQCPELIDLVEIIDD